MTSIAKRNQRSTLLWQARLNLLAELESLEDKLCDKCENAMRLQEINNKECSYNKEYQRGYTKVFVWLIEQAERGAFLYFENYASYGHTKIEG